MPEFGRKSVPTTSTTASLTQTFGLHTGIEPGLAGVGAGSWEDPFIVEGGTSQPGLQARVWGPTLANTFGAEAWVLSKKNFNDGQTWLIKFTWDTTVGYTPHGDGFSTLIVTTADLPDIQDMCAWIANDSRPDVRELWHYAIDMGGYPTTNRSHLFPHKRGR